MSATLDKWLRRYHPAPGARVRLVCLPHAGGAASYFFTTSRALAPDIEVLCVQYPGRQDRLGEPFTRTIPELADAVTAALAGEAGRPLALFGHSMGAIVAFETALRLERTGVVPAALFVSGRRAPGIQHDDRVHLRDDAGLIEEVRSLSGAAAATVMDDDELVRMTLPAIRNDYTATETYRYQPGPRLACPIHALVGDADPKAVVDEVRPWADHTSAGFELHVFPGGHFYLDQQATEVRNTITEVI